ELARLSLWLSTAEPGEPLTFIGNLRVGDSLVGAELGELLLGGGDLNAARIGAEAQKLLTQHQQIVAMASHTVEEVHKKESLSEAMYELRAPLIELADASIAEFFDTYQTAHLHWDLEFPEIFMDPESAQPLLDGGFDAVIGNPPYIQIQSLDRELAEYCRKRYTTASGSFDIYVMFMELGLRLLNRRGRLGFILPNKFLKLEYGKKLRALLSESDLADEIIDFGDAQIFPGVTTYTCIVLLDRSDTGELVYRKLLDSGESVVRRGLADPESITSKRFNTRSLGAESWVLLAGAEAEVMMALHDGSVPLEGACAEIFVGLQTSADPIYIVRDLGSSGRLRRVYSRASEQVLELERNLLHPLASGVDVGPYAFNPLDDLLIFPYKRDDDNAMRLLTPDELSALPMTNAYLTEHEQQLRDRERGKMNHDGWYGFGRNQNLGAHDSQKLGVAATVQRLEVAADFAADIYFHNVRVNGILPKPSGPTLKSLLAIMNSRAVDWAFRRGAAEHANGYFAANKQFIAPLPIRLPSADEERVLAALGQDLHDLHRAVTTRRRAFTDWLSTVLDCDVNTLKGKTKILAFDRHDVATFVGELRKNRESLGRDPESSEFVSLLRREHSAAVDQIRECGDKIGMRQSAVDEAVFDLYELSGAHQDLINGEYGTNS
ncbi:MAG: Eco57I restriction-modification methylase domain-containing protein, partial [Thermoleophilia bacterium]|nr:Eco57I restriction-modification methylase domain-containing protein [Thermoleophilia bacterium]